MKIARKDHSCHWCGETIASGNEFELFQTNVANPRGGFKVVRHRYHPECRTPKDQATLHGIGGIEGRQVRGEFPCPNDTDGDGDCKLCCNTPYRRLARGENKPALVRHRLGLLPETNVTSGVFSKMVQDAILKQFTVYSPGVKTGVAEYGSVKDWERVRKPLVSTPTEGDVVLDAMRRAGL